MLTWINGIELIPFEDFELMAMKGDSDHKDEWSLWQEHVENIGPYGQADPIEVEWPFVEEYATEEEMAEFFTIM